MLRAVETTISVYAFETAARTAMQLVCVRQGVMPYHSVPWFVRVAMLRIQNTIPKSIFSFSCLGGRMTEFFTFGWCEELTGHVRRPTSQCSQALAIHRVSVPSVGSLLIYVSSIKDQMAVSQSSDQASQANRPPHSREES
jgi:hypothetical protein